eukprot:SM000007S20937  [mRNA]  locus=s7:998716:1003912:- [translate_table: standard]
MAAEAIPQNLHQNPERCGGASMAAAEEGEVVTAVVSAIAAAAGAAGLAVAAYSFGQLGVCACCVLRTAGVRSLDYAAPLPPPRSLLAGLVAAASERGAAAPGVPAGGTLASASRPCLLCLGVLQGINNDATASADVAKGGFSGSLKKAQLKEGTAAGDEGDESSVELYGMPGCTMGMRPLPLVDCVAEAVHNEGHVSIDGFCLEVTLPGLLALRERSFWCHLRQQFLAESNAGLLREEVSVSLKEAFKWTFIAHLSLALHAPFSSEANFRIALLFSHMSTSEELKGVEPFLSSAPGAAKRRRQGLKWGSNRMPREAADCGPPEAAARATAHIRDQSDAWSCALQLLAGMDTEAFVQHYASPPRQARLLSPSLFPDKACRIVNKQLETCCELAVFCWRNPVFIGGWYLKFSRNIPQSRWLIDEERMGDGSVQELIADRIVPHFRADNYKFHAAGREDMDVLMLGNGRPFLVEVLNARDLPCQTRIEGMEAAINGSKEGWVKVRRLQMVGPEALGLMRDGELSKQKEYRAVVWLSRPANPADVVRLEALKNIVIEQRTPIRVLHRRSPLVRLRTIHDMRCQLVQGSSNYIVLYLCTQVSMHASGTALQLCFVAGTYVKEFVHGDLGRTQPNLGSLLGCEADILQLDVMGIRMEYL